MPVGGNALHIYYTHFEITGDPCDLIGFQQCDLITNRNIFALNRILFFSQSKWKWNNTNQSNFMASLH